jgi:UDP:flavonoid glycosyltransferase YjiC (YdhE family)
VDERPKVVQRDDSTPPIVFTCGSAMTHASAFLSVAAEVGDMLDRRVLVLTDKPVELPRQLSGRVECRSYVPFRSFLTQAAVIDHHGGIGTTSSALAAGIPQVIVPLLFDQFDNAERCVRLGVARKVSRQRFWPRSLAEAIRELLESPGVAERCRYWQAQMSSEKALVLACETVEDLLR